MTRKLSLVITGVTLCVLLAAACSDDETSAAKCSVTGGPVNGAPDNHCLAAQPVTQASCHPAMGGSGGTGGGEAGAGGMAEEELLTLHNTEGDDDDCKYHVTWSATPICANTDVTFTVHVTKKADGAAATGAGVDAEVFLDETHPAPNSGQHVTETSPGTYDVGPIRFDLPGQWTVRFHFYEDCSDEPEDSPHGHAAFYVNVP